MTEERRPGDGRAIENPQQPADVHDDPPVDGETADDVGDEGERVAEPGDGLVTEEGVNERDTRAP